MTAQDNMDKPENTTSSSKKNKLNSNSKSKETKQTKDEKINNDDLKILEEKLQAANKDIQEQKDKYIRAVAELENVRRRFEREKSDIGKYCFENFFTDMLPVLDSFDKALLEKKRKLKRL